MPEVTIRGKSIAAVGRDVAEGYLYVTPLVLKKFDTDSIKDLHHVLLKIQKEIRMEQFPQNDILAIRQRNLRLQRVHQALIVLKNTARERRVIL
jgi:hypothetical protein